MPIGVLGIAEWEIRSVSPFGGSRIGGSDQRQFRFSPDGRYVVTEDAGGWQLEMWEVASGKSLGQFGKISDPVAVAFLPDGRFITASQKRGSHAVDLWDPVRQQLLSRIDGGVNAVPFAAVAVSPDGRTVALGPARLSRDSTVAGVRLWDVASGLEIAKLSRGKSMPEGRPYFDTLFESLAFSPDGRMIAASLRGEIVVWELASGELRAELATLPLDYREGWRMQAAELQFSRDGRLLAAACSDGVIRLWNVLKQTELPPLLGHQGAVRAVHFATDGETMISLGRNNRLLAWPLAELDRRILPQGELSDERLEQTWRRLGAEDPAAAYRAMRVMEAIPRQAVALFEKQLQPTPAVDSNRLKKAVDDLYSTDYNTRRRAIDRLREYGELAIAALSQRRPDRRRRDLDLDLALSPVVAELRRNVPTSEQLQALRAIEVLDRIGGDEPAKVLRRLAGGAEESQLTQRARSAFQRIESRTRRVAEFSADSLWTELAGDDAQRAFAAMQYSIAHGGEVVARLSARLLEEASAPLGDEDELARLIRSLDSDEFAVRERASQELLALGPLAAPAVRQALADSESAEQRLRLTTILDKIDKARGLKGQLLAWNRAVETLERIQTAEARAALEEVGEKTASPYLGGLAREALQRWPK